MQSTNLESAAYGSSKSAALLKIGRLVRCQAGLRTRGKVEQHGLPGCVDPAALRLDVGELDESLEDLGVGHILDLGRLAGLAAAAEPDLLEVVVAGG